jgi:hypothetical protein
MYAPAASLAQYENRSGCVLIIGAGQAVSIEGTSQSAVNIQALDGVSLDRRGTLPMFAGRQKMHLLNQQPGGGAQKQ